MTAEVKLAVLSSESLSMVLLCRVLMYSRGYNSSHQRKTKLCSNGGDSGGDDDDEMILTKHMIGQLITYPKLNFKELLQL